MKKRVFALLLIAVLLLAGCGKKKDQEETTVPAQSAAEETTMVTVPGVADSIFDENGNVVAEYTVPETEMDSTKPTETKPPVVIPTGPGGSDGAGLQDPEAPEDPDISAPVKPTQPAEQKPEPTQPKEKEPEESDSTELTYEKFQDMSPSQQQSTMESFGSIQDFFKWYENAKQEYETANPPIDVGDGSLDMEDIVNGSN